MLTPLAVSYANSNIPVSTLGSCVDLRESFDGAGSFLTSGDFGEIRPDWEMSQKKTCKSVCLLTSCFVICFFFWSPCATFAVFLITYVSISSIFVQTKLFPVKWTEGDVQSSRVRLQTLMSNNIVNVTIAIVKQLIEHYCQDLHES